MKIRARTRQEWFELLSFALKVLVIVAAPCMFWCDRELATTLGVSQLHAVMREFVVPTQIGYTAIFFLLMGIGIVELSDRRYWRATLDFLFAVAAFFCIYLLEPLVVKLK